MGESKLELAKREKALLSCADVQTEGGRVQLRWESQSAATPMGQLAYFIESLRVRFPVACHARNFGLGVRYPAACCGVVHFLTLTGLWSRWRDSCRLSYVSPNAPSKADVLSTWMLSALSGHRRYSHVTAIRCDGVNPGLLGMNKVIFEDALRRALTAIPQAAGTAWLDGHLNDSVAPLLDAPWILDIDTTVKPLYGKQEGAVVSYNPKKPGRSSHSYHTYLMAGLRLVLGAEARAGNQHTGNHSMPWTLAGIGPPQTHRFLPSHANGIG